MKANILIFLLLNSGIIFGQLNFDWAKVNSELGTFGDFNSDASGNIYQTKFNTFSKYTTSGDLIWKKTVMPTQFTTTVSIENIHVLQTGILITGAIYVTTSGTDSADFDPGAGKAYLKADVRHSAFIAKYTLDGNLIFAKKLTAANTSYNDFLFVKASTDNAGNIYAAGIFRGTVDFNPGPGVFNLFSTNNTGYFSKYDAAGNFLWAKKIDNNEVEGVSVAGISVDNSNRLSLAGNFKGTADFDPSSGTASKTSVGYSDAFIAQYDLNGNFLWVNNLDDNGEIYFSNLSTDESGNMYAIGIFRGTVDFDPGAGATTYTSSEYGDLFAAKYSSSGNYTFSNRIVGQGGGTADNQGNMYLVSGETTTTLTKYSNTGSTFWNQTLEMPQPEITLGGSNEVFLSGNVSNSRVADLDPGAGDYTVIGPERDGTYYFAEYSFTKTQEPFISERSQWKYLDNGTNQGTGWRASSYNDSGWKTGLAELGYGDSDENTVVSFGSNSSAKYITTYFRKTVSISNPSQYSSFELQLLKDDGAVVYINGVEVLRSNMPSGTITSSTLASSALSEPAEATFTKHTISSSKFINGNNTIAVEIHQSSGNSSDLSFNMKLKGLLSAAPPSSCSATGTILREYWANVTGDHVNQIPVTTAPTSTSQLSSFEGPTNTGDNYADRIKGFICAPTTGNYRFWIAADDDAELWLSTNDSPSSKVKIASVTGWTNSREWTKYPSQQSALIYLTAGSKYYIEALHKEAVGGDNLAVGWQTPEGTMERPIPGIRLSPATSTTPSPNTDLILAGGSWKYLDNGTNQGTTWKAVSYNETGWKTGNTELGYGDGGEATVVGYGTSSTNKYITTYFRKSFNVSDVSAFSSLELSLIRDDGAVVYLNGVEVYRNNMPAGTIYYNTLAPNYVDGASESTYVIANISKASLVNGNNVIAVEIHQNSRSSSDISFNLKLKGISGGQRMEDIALETLETKDDFVPYDFILYPNPTTGRFTMEYCVDELKENTFSVEILNSLGQTVFQKQLSIVNGCVKEVIELEQNLPSGIYVLNIIKENKKESKRIVLTR
ncbi:MAG: PA14 domain-containing protein [Bacteroidota bacterium]